MKNRRKNLFLLAAISLTLSTPAAFAASLYWDTNGTGSTGSGAAAGTWGTSVFWSTDSTGANVGTPVLTANATGVDDLFFSAGTNGTGGTVTVNTTQTARLLTLEEGALTFSGGTLSLAGGGGITVASTAGNATISSNLTISGNNIINVGSSRTLTLDTGTFTRNAGATVNVQGAGTGSSTMAGLSTNVNRIIGPWASVATGTTTTYAILNGASLGGLAYAASPTAVQGTLVTATTNVISTASPGTVNYSLNAAGTLGASANINTLRYTGSGGTLATSTSFTTKGIMNSGTGVLTFSGAVSSGASGTEMVVNAANNAITFNGAFTGTLTKTGSGTVTLASAAHSIGGITVNEGILITNHSATTNGITGTSITVNSGGTLRFGGSDDFSNSALFTVNAGANLDLNAFNDTIGAIAGAGSITSASPATLALSSGTQTFSGVIGGAVALTINGAVQTLSGANTYSGTTTVNAGTLDLGGGTATGSLDSPTLTLTGGTFSYTRTGNTTQGFTTTNINGPSQISVASGNTLNLGTVVRGVGTLDFSTTGAGTVAALAASNVNGIMPGLSFGNTWAVANGAGVAISGLAGGSYTLTSVAGTTGTNYLNGNIDVDNSAGLLDAAITANSLRFSSAAANTVTLAPGTNTLSAGGILVGSAVGNNLSTITGGTLTGGTSQNLAIIQNNSAGGLTISSSIVDNTLTSVTKSGAGLLTIDAANTYTGGTTINAGTLKLSGTGTTGLAGSAVAVSSGALLDLNGTSRSIAFTAGTGVGTVANNSGSGTSILTLAANPGANVSIQDNTTTSGGKVAVVVTVDSSGLSATNTYSGGTTVSAGAYLYVTTSDSQAGTGPINLTEGTGTRATSSGLLVNGITVANDITGAGYVHLNANGAFTAVLTGTLNTSGTFNFRNAAAVYDFAGSGNSTLSGVIGPAGAGGDHGPNTTVSTGSIIKSGSGTLTLSGTNAYTGTTTISGGILQLGAGGTTGKLSTSSTIVNNANLTINRSDAVAQGTDFSGAAITGTGSLTQAGAGTTTLTAANAYTGATTVSAGTLYVTGALSNSAVTVQANGTIGSNGAAGTLGSNLTILAGGNLDLTGATLAANSLNILSLTGVDKTLTLGNLTFEDLIGWNWLAADPGTYELIDGAFTVDFGSTAYTNPDNAYVFGNGNMGYFTSGSLNAVIVAVPEPNVAALIGGFGLFALLRRRRN